MKIKQLILLSVFSIAFIPFIQGQKQFEAGVKIINEFSYHRYSPGFGGLVIYKWTKNSGVESGLYYKINQRTFVDGINLVTNAVLKEKTLLIPLMYRFDTKIANLSAGGTTSYILNYQETNKVRSHESGRFEFAAAISISKSLRFGSHWIFEPEIRSTAPIPEGGVYTSLNFSIRKKI